MLVSDFHFDLPDDLIAQQPPAVRGSSRMLQLARATGAYEDRNFADLPEILQPGDLLILNNSRVLAARLFATRVGLTTQHNSPAPSGQIEVLLTQPLASEHNDWTALVKPAKKVQVGETLHFGDPALTATVLSSGEFGERTLRFAPVLDFHATLERIGHLPLPPYIHRPKSEPNTQEDRERYQTVFSMPFEEQWRRRHARALRLGQTPEQIAADFVERWHGIHARAPRPHETPEQIAARLTFLPLGSAAAPTAGLHFTPEILARLEARGVEVRHITLHVGLGTFQPVRVDRTEDIRLHAESFTFPGDTAAAINRAQKEGRRIIAVGTTTTRTLEHIARRKSPGAPFWPHSSSTSLFLSPGLNDDFKIVTGLLTNFHLPESTLLMLVSAFAGREAVLNAYAHAVAARYRFFSYGDCMLIL
jgi:S-adenosylmethionine:tRNA ribosyltransferase-isomerase